MYKLSILCRKPQGSLSKDLAKQICERGQQGRVVVVTDKPIVLLSATKKQWLVLIRRVQRDRASTLDTIKIGELTQKIAWMQSLSFTAATPDDLLEADVTFATAEDFVQTPPVCETVYITYKFEPEKLHMLTSWMPKGGLVIIYGQQ